MKTKLLLSVFLACGFALRAFAGVEQAVNDLIPKLAAANVEDRYGPQMELQGLVANASRPGAKAERAELAGLLAAKAADPAVPQPARVWLVRQLEYIGAAESVTALTTLLNGQDQELKECARRALEKNSAPAATESLRAALKQGGETGWQAGLIQSLGERGDASSVSLLVQSLGKPELSFAAASALAKIGSDSAVKELWTAFDKQIASAADALAMAADRLAAKGQEKKAAAIYRRLYTACSAPQLRAAALSGIAKTEPSAAKKLVQEALSAREPELQTAAVAAACEVYGKNLSAEMTKLLPGLNAPAKVLALRLLDASAEKQVIAVAADPDETVRLAAIETLGQIGGAASVPVLMKAATQNESAAQKAAAASLAKLSGTGANDALSGLAAQGDTKSRAAAINALAQRHTQAALPALLQYAAESDRAISSAACAALGKMGTDNELDGLVRLALAGKTPGADAALQAVAGRARDKSAVAAKLIAQARTARPEQLGSIFDILAMLGGNEALTAMSQSASSASEEVKDAAIRALANWPDFAAAKPLLAIASDPNAKRVHNVLAIQGVTRLVKVSEKEPAAARLDAALAAMNAARRDEEKKLVLSALASVPHAKAAEAIKPFLNDPNLKTEAGLAGATLAQALVKTDKPAARDLAQALKDANLSAETSRKADAILKK
jgi:HEAT repeat protein